MKLSMKIRAHEAELLVAGTEEEQTAEIIRIMLQGCTAEVPSRLLADRGAAGKLCGACGRTAPALTTAELPSISSLRDLAGGTM